MRNTPTGVGKTDLWVRPAYEREKHPHGRGEDSVFTRLKRSRMETPPRAWGRLRGQFGLQAAEGNTPTGVGKTGKEKT